MPPVHDKLMGPGCAQSVTKSWDERGTCKAVLPHTGLPRGPDRSPQESPGRTQTMIRSWDERNLQGSSSSRGCPEGPECFSPLSILLLLGFLLIFGNVTHSDQASLEKSKPI